jgi:flagellar hook-length control protein FliK
MVNVTAPATVNALLGTPASPAAPSGNGNTSESKAFARQLERAAHDGDAASAQTASDAAAQADANQRSVARGKARSPTDRPPGERTPAHAAAKEGSGTTGAEKAADEPAAAKDSTPSDVSALLASLMAHRGPQADAPRDDARAGGATATDAKVAKAGADSRAAAADALRTGGDGPPELHAKGDAEATLPTLPASAAAFVLPQQPDHALQAADSPPPSAAPVREAQVNAAVGTPEFAPGLSAEVNVMLRDGVQEARLQLSPAEMGPITVQIQIEGGTAQVHMAAEQAGTRQALEQAMPELAGAFRDNGLTLTGGGVFEQPQQPRDDGAPARGGGSPAAGSAGGGGDSAPVAAAPARRVAAPGAVDLYA